MTVVTAFHPGDADQALRQAEWLQEIVGAKGHGLILIRDTRCSPEITEQIRETFALSYDSVQVHDFVDHYRHWPESPNEVFAMAARHMAALGKSWFFCEPDCVFLKAGALNEIESEYERALKAGKFFLGDLVTAAKAGVPLDRKFDVHMSGNAVYPADMFKHAGFALIANELAFDVAAASQILPQMQESELIVHRWKHPPFTSWEQVQADIFDKKPKACLFHADKTGSLYPLLREHNISPVECPNQSGGEAVRRALEPDVTCDIFIKTYPPDYPWLEYCLRSVQKFAHGFNALIIAAPDEEWLKVCDDPPLIIDRPDLPLAHRQFIKEETDGYLGQQVAKLYADGHSASGCILFTDSDTIFTRPVTPETYFTDGRIDWLMTPWAKTETPWQPITEKFLGRPVEFEFMRRMPFMIPRWLLQAMRQFCEQQHGMTLDKYVMSQPHRAFSEFNCLGAFAYAFHRDKFHWINTEEVPADQWPPLTVRQEHSWGGLHQDIIGQFEIILSESSEPDPVPVGGTGIHGIECTCLKRDFPCPFHFRDNETRLVLSESHSTTETILLTSPGQTPWESKEQSLSEIRTLAERLKNFCDLPSHVCAVRLELHNAGVIVLPYRFKRRKGKWKRKAKK